jgi:hypothetical protein
MGGVAVLYIPFGLSLSKPARTSLQALRLAFSPEEGVNESAMPAHHARTPPLCVANARHSPRYGCALRLDWARSGALLGHAGFIHTF